MSSVRVPGFLMQGHVSAFTGSVFFLGGAKEEGRHPWLRIRDLLILWMDAPL